MSQIHGQPGAPRRRRRVLPWVPVALLLLVVLELAVIIAVGRRIGVLWTIVSLVALSVAGVWLLRREGARAMRALRTSARTGEVPSRALADGILVLVGGLLLVLPGFVTDVVGLLLVLPFTRPLARPLLEAGIRRRVFGDLGVIRVRTATHRDGRTRRDGPEPGDEVVEGEIVD